MPPKSVEDHVAKTAKLDAAVKDRYDATAKDLPALVKGDHVYVQSDVDGRWRKRGTIVSGRRQAGLQGPDGRWRDGQAEQAQVASGDRGRRTRPASRQVVLAASPDLPNSAISIHGIAHPGSAQGSGQK